ncbi:hypothetical protein [Variovorax saccharolyticus]|uniref:hypothetical protein n=1 Tax=Variovorax saccharolyticus TaxID=3053516 RepID=UPI0025752C97|nr:hypothetical protein [Variovorax sp. J22R187]MDM0022106.1 hypothetical protein [Variovorax sp. J22R187]
MSIMAPNLTPASRWAGRIRRYHPGMGPPDSKFDRYGPFVIAGAFVLVTVVMCVWAIAKGLENRRLWKAYVAENDCHVVASQRGDINIEMTFVPKMTGSAANTSFVPVPVVTQDPDRKVWQCTQRDGATVIHLR